VQAESNVVCDDAVEEDLAAGSEHEDRSVSGASLSSESPPQVLNFHGRYNSINNRRLAAFKEAQRTLQQELCRRVTIHSSARPNEFCGGQRN